MKRTLVSFTINCIVMPLCIVGGLWLGASKADDKKPAKKRPAGAHEVPSRAFEKAKSNPFKIKRVTAAYDTSDEDQQKTIVIVEFENKQVGVYAGYADEKEDQWIVFEQENLPLVKEAIDRCGR